MFSATLLTAFLNCQLSVTTTDYLTCNKNLLHLENSCVILSPCINWYMIILSFQELISLNFILIAVQEAINTICTNRILPQTHSSSIFHMDVLMATDIYCWSSNLLKQQLSPSSDETKWHRPYMPLFLRFVNLFIWFCFIFLLHNMLRMQASG